MTFNNFKIATTATRFTVLFSVGAALIFPLGYFAVSFQYQKGIMETEAEINAALISRVISANPELWRYETVRIEELLARRPRSGTAETRRLFDAKQNLIAESVNPVRAPRVKVSHEVIDAEEVVGRIEINRSLLPILLHSGILSLLGMALGLLFFHRLPFNALIKAGRMLQDANEFLFKVMEGSRSSLIVLDLDGTIRMCNKRFQDLTGYPGEELMGRSFIELFTGDSREQVEAELHKVSSGNNQNATFESVLSVRNGNILSLDCAAETLVREGTISGLIISLDDITERKRAAEEKRIYEMNLQQTQKLESLGVLAGGVAHDFNNILAIIMGNCYLAKEHPGDFLTKVSQIETAVDRAALLCRQMMTYAGKTQLIHTQINFSALVEEVVMMLKSTSPKNVNIFFDSSAEIPFIMGDVGQISQLILNLTINASEAIGVEQGEIRVSLVKASVSAEQTDFRDHLGKIIPPGLYVRLEVTDNGCGMDEETKQRIFEPFYSTKFAGRGLGMSAVLGIVAAHKGAVQISSHTGRGTTFKVYLPVQASDSMVVESPQQADPAPWQGNGTILLVEDEEMILYVAKTMLNSMGFTVIEASNGKDALELFQKNAEYITLVVTDLSMPVMDGYELIRELKKLDPARPIIICSGYDEETITARISREDIAGIISKPYHVGKLREVLMSVLEGK